MKQLIRTYENVIDEIIELSEDSKVSVNISTQSICQYYTTLENPVTANFSGGILSFSDDNPDTITRDKGDFIEDNFKVGMTIIVSNTTSNNGSYTIDSVEDKKLTLDVADNLSSEEASNGSILGELRDMSIWDMVYILSGAEKTFYFKEHRITAIRVKQISGAGEITVRVRS